MAKKQDASKLVTIQAAVPVLICKANRPLSEELHEQLVRKLKEEEARTGVEILLVPHAVDVTVGAEIKEVPQEEKSDE
ncbi:hypothetical protein ACF3MZ_21310 [Paenibacillaceae bacterium WGS1546]|uniref:hypothetical protein n=1 Tax=Cohnella sp. WGS1546 TaxID=3366810 RepID=UPI00372D01A2